MTVDCIETVCSDDGRLISGRRGLPLLPWSLGTEVITVAAALISLSDDGGGGGGGITLQTILNG